MLPTLIILGVTMVFVITAILVIKKCYFVVGPDQAFVRTGFGAAEVRTAGGMLLFPVNRVQTMSLAWQAVNIEFPTDQPLSFTDRTQAMSITIWISVANDSDSILEAAQLLGTGEVNEVTLSDIYAVPIRQAIVKSAADLTAESWLAKLPDVHQSFYKLVEGVLEPFHQVHRVNIELTN